jgi:hypothetical protein
MWALAKKRRLSDVAWAIGGAEEDWCVMFRIFVIRSCEKVAVARVHRIIRLKAKAYVLWLELDLTGFQQ